MMKGKIYFVLDSVSLDDKRRNYIVYSDDVVVGRVLRSAKGCWHVDHIETDRAGAGGPPVSERYRTRMEAAKRICREHDKLLCKAEGCDWVEVEDDDGEDDESWVPYFLCSRCGAKKELESKTEQSQDADVQRMVELARYLLEEPAEGYARDNLVDEARRLAHLTIQVHGGQKQPAVVGETKPSLKGRLLDLAMSVREKPKRRRSMRMAELFLASQYAELFPTQAAQAAGVIEGRDSKPTRKQLAGFILSVINKPAGEK